MTVVRLMPADVEAHPRWGVLLRMLPEYDPCAQAQDCYFDPEKAEHVLRFFREQLRHPEPPVQGMPYLLQPWQECFLANLFGWRHMDGRRRFRQALLYVPKKNGKALDLDTPLPTPSGWTTVGDVREGDTLFDERGRPCLVLGLSETFHGRTCYRVTFSDGTEIVADAEHRWRTNVLTSEYAEQVLTTEQIRNTLTTRSDGARNHSIPVADALQLEPAGLPIGPYTLGLWLGDGNSANARVTYATSDAQVLREVESEGYLVGASRLDKRSAVASCGIGMAADRKRGVDCLQVRLRVAGLLHNKHIPSAYLRGSEGQRLALLCGLMDSDGTVSTKGQCSFTNTNRRLFDGVVELLRTLGFKPSIRQIVPSCQTGASCATAWTAQFWAFSDRPCFRLARKVARLRSPPDGRARSRTRQIVAVDPVDSRPSRCLAVSSPSHLFLAGRGMVPTHNTEMIAGVTLYMMVNAPDGAKMFGAAAAQDQAGLLYGAAAGMIAQNAELDAERGGLIHRYGDSGGTVRRSLVITDRRVSFRVLCADAKTTDGVGGWFNVIDELHRHLSSALMQTLVKGATAQREPLTIFTTTADYNRKSPCNDKLAHAKAVRANKGDRSAPGYDPSFLPAVWEAKAGDDWRSVETWRKANPNFGVSVTEEAMREAILEVETTPSETNNLLRLNLNIVTDADQAWLSKDDWAACTHRRMLAPDAGEWDWRGWARALNLHQRRGCAGLDLSKRHDLSALVMAFEPEQEGDPYTVLPFFWIPQDTMERAERRDRVPYSQWVREGFLFVTDGNTIDTTAIRRHVLEVLPEMGVSSMAYDPWGAHHMALELKAEGVDVVEFKQIVGAFAQPMQMFERLVKRGGLEHGGHPVLTWNAWNVSVHRDGNENMKPMKNRSTGRIDGVVAAVMAFGLLALNAPEPEGDIEGAYKPGEAIYLG